MNINKLTVLFLLHKHKINKRGRCPIICRITYQKKRKEFATGLFINPKYWNNKKQKILEKADNASIVNSQLSLISQKINEAFLLLQLQYKDFDVKDLYSQYKGDNIRVEKTLLELYDLHNNTTKELVGIDFNNTSWSRYVENKRKVAEYIKHKYGKDDIKLNQLDLKFIKGLEYYFKTKKKLSQATINRSLQRVKKVIQFGIAENYLDKNPFVLYKPTKYKLKLVYLTEDELLNLEDYVFEQPKLEKVKDLFVFCCYTGLAYQEMANLQKKNIIKRFDDNMWIDIIRQKTESKVLVPLLPRALEILDKYEYTLPKISNQKFNSYLKEIAGILGIEKKLTHHTARKTFATTVLLNNGVPMEVVSELLGHSRMQVTQKHYAKVVQHKVSSQMNKLSKKLRNKG